jgi:uncharacterized lipoprotein YddW (UPF0748 family)
MKRLSILLVFVMLTVSLLAMEFEGSAIMKMAISLNTAINDAGRRIPASIAIPGTDKSVSMEEAMYLVAKWMALYGENGEKTGEMPETVPYLEIKAPEKQIQVEIGGMINWPDIYDVSKKLAAELEVDRRIPPQVEFVLNGEETSFMAPDILLYVLTRSVNWVNDNASMPNYASLREVTPPSNWPPAEKTTPPEVVTKVSGTAGEIRAIWAWSSDFESYGIEKAVSDLKSAGFTDVYLLVKGTAGRVSWPSAIAYEAIDDTTILEKTVESCRAAGMSIHAWFVINQDQAYLKQHPNSKMQGVPLNEGDPARFAGSTVEFVQDTRYRKYLTDLMKEVIELYDVDGIHLDYIRFPTGAWGWGPYSIGRAWLEGLDVDFLMRTAMETWGSAGDNRKLIDLYREFRYFDINRWVEMRMDDIRAFTEEIKAAVESVKPDIIYSAALMPEGGDINPASNGFAMVHYGQRYADFGDLCDIVIPMSYHLDFGKTASWVSDVTKGTRDAVRSDTKVVMGIQAYDLSPLELQKAIYAARSAGADGIMFFRFGTLFGNENLKKALLEALE